MTDVDKALQTQLQNIQTKTGKSLDELVAMVRKSGLEKHGQIRDMLKEKLGLGHGDANTLTHVALSGGSAPKGDDLDEIYAGPKAALRPIHEKLMAAIGQFGELEIAPKKGYVSLRRKKQFAMIGPATKDRVEVGINLKSLSATARLLAEPPGRMCPFKVKVTDPKEVDAELLGWIRAAYDSAG